MSRILGKSQIKRPGQGSDKVRLAEALRAAKGPRPKRMLTKTLGNLNVSKLMVLGGWLQKLKVMVLDRIKKANENLGKVPENRI